MEEGNKQTDDGPKNKTVIFEDKYGVDISSIYTTEEVDEVIEKGIGRKLRVIDLHGNLITDYGDIDTLYCGTIKKRSKRKFLDNLYFFS